MIFIAGAGPDKPEKYITLKPRHCNHCNNDTFWILEKTKYFVTLFFLPVFPMKTEYRFYCPICGNMKQTEKEEFERIVRFEAEPYHGNGDDSTD